jgi:hypothetical protein
MGSTAYFLPIIPPFSGPAGCMHAIPPPESGIPMHRQPRFPSMEGLYLWGFPVVNTVNHVFVVGLDRMGGFA